MVDKPPRSAGVALRLLARLLTIAAALCLCGPSLALDQQFTAYKKQLDKIEHTLDRHRFTRDDLGAWLTDIADMKSAAGACVSDLEGQLEKLKADLATLGEPVAKEPADVVRQRRRIERAQIEVEKDLAACRLLALRSDTLLKRVSGENKALLAQELTARAPSLPSILNDNLREPMIWIEQTGRFLDQQSRLLHLGAAQWALVAGVAGLFAALGFRLRRLLLSWAAADVWHDDFPSRFSRALITSLAHYTPLLSAAAALSILALIYSRGVAPTPFIVLAAYSLLAYVLVAISIRLLFAPPAPAALFLPMTPDIAHGLSKRLRVLALIAVAGYLLITSLVVKPLPESAAMLAYSVLAFLIVGNVIWALWLLLPSPRLREQRPLIVAVILVLAVSLLVEWIGYRNLASATRRVVIGTFIAFAVTLLLGRLMRDLFDAIDNGSYAWTRRLRRSLGVRSEGHVTGVMWLRLVSAIVIWSLFVLMTLYSWGISETVIRQIRNYVMQGFDIGSLHVIPVKIFWAAVSFAVLLTIVGWFRSRLEHRWLLRTPLDRGAREALVAISGYTLVALAILISLGIAGLDFGKIALIAGALSVGIGFGLQNIVNNFISGLILLFERPVKTGDWIVVGNTEGYVKQIRIRSTQIETFDRADVIVPNSELISNQVTNWMLRSARGRVRVAVGVAYGSDTGLVKRLLEQVASDHTRVITDGSAPKPTVMFRAFGDSSLDFELRAHIYNIDERLNVISDLNFAIDRIFREHGVEIPFPQRDIHVRDWQPPPEEQH